MKKTILALVIAVVAGLPLGWMVAMLLTPVLWRLEPVLHMELAGHSGPSDWVILVLMATTVSGFFLLLRGVFFGTKRGG
jgi:hypothetical protein